jgi:uncharacterized membrane protein YqjE
MDATVPTLLLTPCKKHSRLHVKYELQKLLSAGQSWIAAEAALAKAELASDGKRLILLIALGALACGCVFSAVMMLSLFLVSLLAPYVGGLTAAAGVLVLALLIMAFICTWLAIYLARSKLGILALLERWKQFADRRQKAST